MDIVISNEMRNLRPKKKKLCFTAVR